MLHKIDTNLFWAQTTFNQHVCRHPVLCTNAWIMSKQWKKTPLDIRVVINTSFDFFCISTSVLILGLIILWYLFRPPFPKFWPLYHTCSRGGKFTPSSLHELGTVNAFVHIVQSHHNAPLVVSNCSLHVPLKRRYLIKKSDHTKSTYLALFWERHQTFVLHTKNSLQLIIKTLQSPKNTWLGTLQYIRRKKGKSIGCISRHNIRTR